MLKSYFKAAFRNFYKNKGYSFINITGLSVGMAVAILIGLWIWDEVSFDSNFQNHNRIAQVIQNVSNNGEIQTWRQVLKKYNPAQPFEYQFADLEYAKKFGNEEHIGKLASAFAGLAIFISCLGLFGMAAFMAERRIKEIGVRKVLGASAFSLWGLMSKEFVLLVIISLFIAIPVTYFGMYSWLNNYDYHADVAWWLFAITGMSTMAIALLTVSYQSIKAVLTNPIKSLRTE